MGADLIKSLFIKKFIPVKRDDFVREFVDTILDAVIFVSYSYHIKWANREALRMLGYQESEMAGKNFRSILGENFALKRGNFYNLLTTSPVKNYDSALKKKDGSEFPVKMNIMPFTDSAEMASGWLIMAKDMSGVKNLIRQLISSNKKAKHIIRELEHSRDELVLSEKLAFAGRIAASVAHEIRNPLNIIGMAIQQLQSELGKKDSRKEYTQMAIEHINRVNKLLTEFVNVTRPVKLRMRWGDINAVLEEVIKLLQPKIQECKAAVIIRLDRELPQIKMDRNHMIQAITNLLINSCEAIPKDGGKIWIISKRHEYFIEIIIRNNGKPIPKKELIQIFDPFFTTKKSGTGLGTSITYTIIGSHRGTISVDSNRKRGTLFNIRLTLPREEGV